MRAQWAHNRYTMGTRWAHHNERREEAEWAHQLYNNKEWAHQLYKEEKELRMANE